MCVASYTDTEVVFSLRHQPLHLLLVLICDLLTIGCYKSYELLRKRLSSYGGHCTLNLVIGSDLGPFECGVNPVMSLLSARALNSKISSACGISKDFGKDGL